MTSSHSTPLLSGRSSVECSQDVSHILHSAFHKYSLHELESELVTNILSAKGSKNNLQESYVEALELVKNEYTKQITGISSLERHIMHAQTRVVSANERNLLASHVPQDVHEQKVKSSLRDCLDPELLEQNKLISPKDFFQQISPISTKPKASKKPNYLKSLTRAENGSKDESRNVLIAWADEGIDLDDHVVMEESSVFKTDRIDRPRKAVTSEDLTPRKEAFWKEHTSVERRNEEKNQLELLLKKTDGLKNSRFLKSQEAGRTKSLVRVYPPGERPEDPIKLPPIFIANPTTVLFASYEPGKVYEATLELRNVSAVLQSCRVIPPKSGFFGINFGEFPSETSLIAPGMACLYRIRFLPDALCEFEDALTVHIPERPPLVIPLIGRRPPPILNISSDIDVGECLIAATKVYSIKLKNGGGEGKFCVLAKSSWPCASFKQAAAGNNHNRGIDIGDNFSIYPGTFRLKPNEEMTLQVIFQPLDTRRHSTEFVMICDNCHVRSFSLVGEGVRLQFDIVHIDGGLYQPTPSDYVDAFATSHIAFPALNLGMAFDKKLRIRNNRKMDIPFVWAIVKPHLVAPIPPLQLEPSVGEAETFDQSQPVLVTPPVKIPDCRIIEEQAVFSIEPQTGILQSGATMEFTLSYLPDKVCASHSALHLIIPGVPQPVNTPDPAESRMRGTSSSKSDSPEKVPRSAASNQSSSVADVTALEVDLRGSCLPYQLSLHPCAIFMDGETLIRTSSRHQFLLRNDSRGPAAFEWQPIADDDAIVEVEPKIGVLEPGAVAALTAIVTGTKAGKVVKQVPCWIEFCPDAVCLQLEANFKGPECIFKDQNCLQQMAFLDFGLIRSTSLGTASFNITNTSGIDAYWTLTFLSSLETDAFIVEEDENGDEVLPEAHLRSDEIQISQISGNLAPLSSRKVDLKLMPQQGGHRRQRLGQRTGFLKLEVAQGKTRILQLFADIQKPDVCLLNAELSLPGNVFVDTITRETIILINKTNLATEFRWDIDHVTYSENSVCRQCEFNVEPQQGTIGSKEQLPSMLAVKPLKRGILEAFVTCYLPEVDEKLVLFVRATASGLDVTYTVFESAMSVQTPVIPPPPPMIAEEFSSSKCVIDFGQFQLPQVIRRQLVIRNKTLIPTNFSLKVSKFAPTTEVLRSVREPEIRRHLMSSDARAMSDMKAKLLGNGLGLAVVAIPSTGHLPAEGTAVVEVFAVADMWGQYRDELISTVGDLEPDRLKLQAEAKGSPLLFQMMVAQRHKTACCRFGVAVQGTSPITKKLRLLNEGPCDVRLDWRLFDVKPKDYQFVDFIPYMLNPFPDNSSTKAAEPKEVSLQPGERPETQLVSCVLRKHEGVPADENGIFSVNPPQVVVKGRSHATVEVTLDPRQIPALAKDEKFINLEAFGLAFVSLTDEIRQPADGSVTRSQWYDAESVRLGITAQIQPAMLAMETIDDDSLSLSLAASQIVPKSLYSNLEETNVQQSAKVSNRQPITLRFFNYHETELRLSAEIVSPFKIVYFGTAVRNSLLDKPTNKTAEVVLPAHDTLIVKVDVDAGVSMLSDLDSLVPNLALVDGRYLTMSSTTRNRTVHYRRFFSIRYSNDTVQSVRLSCAIPLPSVSINCSELNFPVTLIGKCRELSLDAINASDSDTWLQCHVEAELDADRGCFRVKPNGCRVGPSTGRRQTLTISFTPRHEGLHSARVVIIEKIIGMRFVVTLKGSASFDEKHAL